MECSDLIAGERFEFLIEAVRLLSFDLVSPRTVDVYGEMDPHLSESFLRALRRIEGEILAEDAAAPEPVLRTTEQLAGAALVQMLHRIDQTALGLDSS